MSLQQYFSNKKATFCAFFQNFQQTIKELSIASQLQIDREYFNAKSAVGTETNQVNASNCIASFCASMKNQQSSTLKKIVSLLFQYIQSQINLIYGSSQPNIPQFTQHASIPIKQQPQLVIQKISNPKQNQLQLCIVKQNKMESPQKLQVSQNSQRTVSKDKLKKTEQSGILLSPGMKAGINTNNTTNIKQMAYQSQQTVKKDMPSNIALNNSSSQIKKQISLNKNGKRQEKQAEQQGNKVIQLLNKKRSYSTGRQTTNDRITNSVPNNSLNNSRNDKYSSANKYIAKQLNPIVQCPALDPLSPTSKDFNKNNKHKYNYNQYRQQASQMNGKLHQAQLIDQPSELSLQTNQLLCQKLDKKIHEQAVGMLYKAKNKRSTTQMGAGYSKNNAYNRNDRSGNTIINSSIHQKLQPQIHKLLASNKMSYPKQQYKNIDNSQGMAKDKKHELTDISKNVIPISLVRNHSTNYIGSFNQQQRF